MTNGHRPQPSFLAYYKGSRIASVARCACDFTPFRIQDAFGDTMLTPRHSLKTGHKGEARRNATNALCGFIYGSRGRERPYRDAIPIRADASSKPFDKPCKNHAVAPEAKYVLYLVCRRFSGSSVLAVGTVFVKSASPRKRRARRPVLTAG